METAPSREVLSSDGGAPHPSVYLERLERLLRLRREHHQDLNRQGLNLLDRSIFTAYCDCRDLGVVEEARRVLCDAKFVFDQPKLPLTTLDTGQP